VAGIIAAAVASHRSSRLRRSWRLLILVHDRLHRRYLQGKSAMEAYYTFNENIGLSMSGVMTFFFGSLTFSFTSTNCQWKNTGILD